MTIRVAIAGIRGKMGTEAARAVQGAGDMELVAGLDRPRDAVEAILPCPVFSDPWICFSESRPDVLVDLTHREAAEANIPAAIACAVRPVVGTTGIAAQRLAQWDRELREQKLGGLYAPNFAVGALLMMRACQMIAPFLERAEIVEYHHEAKKDAPSGTAAKTAQLIAERMGERRSATAQASREGDRYHVVDGVPVHSVRLPGLVAHQEVMFGGAGETLTIRHDSLSRASFMPGILLGVRRVMDTIGLVDGLEHFLF